MPNANPRENVHEFLEQVQSEQRQILAQIDSINATIKPWLDELRDLRDYNRQLGELALEFERKRRKVTVVTKAHIRAQIEKEKNQELVDIFKNLNPEQLAELTIQVKLLNGESLED